MKRFLRVVNFVILTAAFLAACVPLAAKESGKMPLATFTEPPKTLIPTRSSGMASAPRTPAPVTYYVATRAGQNLRFESILLEMNEYTAFHTESLPQGIPLQNGVEVALDFIRSVKVGQPDADWATNPDASWPVSLTLSDGRQIHSGMGFKARHKMRLTGYSDYGYAGIDWIDLDSIEIEHLSPARAIPQAPPDDNVLTVETFRGDLVEVADERIFARCMYEVYCCHDETLRAIPLQGEADLPLSELKSAVFEKDGILVITRRTDQPAPVRLRPPGPCPDTPWRVRGKAALGDFEIELSSIKIISKQSGE
jgi:hypothetical protein